MRGTGRLVARTVSDAGAGLAVFMLVAVVAGVGVGSADVSARASAPYAVSANSAETPADGGVSAPLRPAPAPPPISEASHAEPGRETAFYLLAAVFSALVAFNLAFFRHLRRIRAVPFAREDRWQV